MMKIPGAVSSPLDGGRSDAAGQQVPLPVPAAVIGRQVLVKVKVLHAQLEPLCLCTRTEHIMHGARIRTAK